MFWWASKVKEPEKKTNEKKKHETVTRQWSDLPMDLLREVADKLDFADYVRFYAVCKDWHATRNNKTLESYSSLPWLVSIPYSASKVLECHLYEPFSRNPKPTTVLEIPLHQFLSDDNTCSSVDIDIRYKYGWLLLSITNKRYRGCTNFTLFSILTRKVSALPPLHHPQGCNFVLAKSFSSEPNSPNCVFLVVLLTSTKENTIGTLRHGEKEWTTKTVHGRYYRFLGNDAVYIRGIFYFVSRGGVVASYDITHGTWRDERDLDDTVVNNDCRFRTEEVFKLDGDLVRICFGKEYSTRKYLLCFIRKFDLFKKVWVPVKSLGGDRALDNGKLINITNAVGINNWITDEDEDEEITSFWLEPLHHLVRFN